MKKHSSPPQGLSPRLSTRNIARRFRSLLEICLKNVENMISDPSEEALFAGLECGLVASELRRREWISPHEETLGARLLSTIDPKFGYEKLLEDPLVAHIARTALHALESAPFSFDETLLLPSLADSAEMRHQKGIVYTPLAVASWMVSRALPPEGSLTELGKVLDPAVGSGVFLRACANRLRELFPDAHPSGITGRFVGVDRDPRALRLARLALLLDSFERPPNVGEWSPPTLIQADTLIDDWHSTTEQFDLIVGNPPYRLGRGGTISLDERSLLRSRFTSGGKGRVNTYMLFVEKGLSLLSSSGVLSMLVPNAWLGIKEGEEMRRMLLHHQSLSEIDVFPRSVFPGTSVEVVSFTARRYRRSPTICVRRHTSMDFSTTTEIHAPLPRTLRDPIQINFDPAVESFLSIVFAHSVPLRSKESPFQPRIALQVYSRGRGTPPQTDDVVASHPFHVPEPVDDSCIPYLEGRFVSPFFVDTHEQYLRYGAWMAEHQQISLYQRPRVLIREVLSSQIPKRPIAAVCENRATYNRSILHVHCKDDSHDLLYCLAALLNSSIAGLVLFSRGKKSARALFPKIVQADIADFPIPQAVIESGDQAQHLADLSRQVHREFIATSGSPSPLVATLMHSIEQHVAALYQLPYSPAEHLPRFAS